MRYFDILLPKNTLGKYHYKLCVFRHFQKTHLYVIGLWKKCYANIDVVDIVVMWKVRS